MKIVDFICEKVITPSNQNKKLQRNKKRFDLLTEDRKGSRKISYLSEILFYPHWLHEARYVSENLTSN